MTDEEIWNDDTPIIELEGLEVDVPAWIEQDISPYDVAAIYQGGCASGAYMPAVTYYEARKTMNDYGDEVLQYIQDAYGELPKHRDDESWDGIAVFYLSCAVELWAMSAHDALEAYEPDDEESAA